MERHEKKSRKEWVSTASRERLRLSPEEGIPHDRTVSISDTLDNILEGVRMADEHWLNKLRDTWVAVAGDVAKHTVPASIDGKCLNVYVDSSVWLTELSQYGGKQLLKNIRSAGFADKVATIRFQINPD